MTEEVIATNHELFGDIEHPIGIAFLTDLHTGHSRIKPEILHEELRQIFYPKLMNTDQYPHIDILFIGGDFFDTLLDMSCTAGFVAGLIISELQELAKRCGFIIRVIRGTFSHDRHQNQFFSIKHPWTIQQAGADPLVVTYDNIAVEHIKSLNLDVLYIPDDLPDLHVMDEIKAAMKRAQITKVDFIVSHGYFEHLLPPHMPTKPPNILRQETLKPYVRGCVFNGHVHSASIYNNVISGGSFDRLGHGEEEPKGFYTVQYKPTTSTCTYTFHKNTLAHLFKTIDLSSYDNDVDAMAYFIGRLETILADNRSLGTIFIRILTNDPIVRQALQSYVRSNHRNIIVTAQRTDAGIASDTEDLIVSTADLPIITEANLPEMIQQYLAKQHKHIDLPLINNILQSLKGKWIE